MPAYLHVTRNLLAPFRFTVFHPQWVIFRHQSHRLREIAETVHGLVLDIGSGKELVQSFLDPKCTYFSLDFPTTATQWYGTRPKVFGDGQQLPFAEDTFDSVLLLDVMEHLPHPNHCIREIFRVLKPGGILVLHVPFMYPVHDKPHDYHRWTTFGLRKLAERYHFCVQADRAVGTPVESSILITNLGLTKFVFSEDSNLGLRILIGLLLPFLIVSLNLVVLIASIPKKSGGYGFMPYRYEMIWEKPSQ